MNGKRSALSVQDQQLLDELLADFGGAQPSADLAAGKNGDRVDIAEDEKPDSKDFPDDDSNASGEAR